MKATLTKINSEIKQRYPDLEIEFVRGGGYHYFSGLDGLEIESILVPYLNRASLEWWLDTILSNINDMIAQREDIEPVRRENGVIVIGNWK